MTSAAAPSPQPTGGHSAHTGRKRSGRNTRRGRGAARTTTCSSTTSRVRRRSSIVIWAHRRRSAEPVPAMCRRVSTLLRRATSASASLARRPTTPLKDSHYARLSSPEATCEPGPRVVQGDQPSMGVHIEDGREDPGRKRLEVASQTGQARLQQECGKRCHSPRATGGGPYTPVVPGLDHRRQRFTVEHSPGRLS